MPISTETEVGFSSSYVPDVETFTVLSQTFGGTSGPKIYIYKDGLYLVSISFAFPNATTR